MAKEYLFNSETAKEAQRKGAAKRRENAARRRLIKDVFKEYLFEEIDGRTRLDNILIRLFKDISRDDYRTTFDDILKMQKILGEDVLKVEANVASDDDLAERLADIFNGVHERKEAI